MQVPTLPIIKAFRRVPKFAKFMPSCLTSAIHASSPKNGLVKEEVAAIKAYTAQCDVYTLLNQALRSEQLKNIRPWFSYLKLFHMAINKLKPKTGEYCRGENIDQSSKYQVGSIVTWVRKWGVTSLSALPSVCLGFAKPNYMGQYSGVLYSVLSYSARDISVFSNFPGEAESILLPDVNKPPSNSISPFKSTAKWKNNYPKKPYYYI
ncbi:unnamed protein product [Rotaria sordida]|nr:unnamed protein product [Rotaria sordida]CAF0867042.1 unnamed protein product [Rotaria sordida]CAF1236023.1 unnamed protein product [Rotaria sordida]CAF1338196.1 unnamed protein product [Rotaria sordida]CAF3645239.1 unnamed protein product [Rotaria sordida]